MRLICPNCGAQYEVDESVIPDVGRDVQCSNCGQAWFQMSASQIRAQEAEAAAAEAEAPEGTEEWDEPEEPEPEAEEALVEVAEVAPPEPAAEPVEAEPSPPEAAEPEPKRKTLDDAVMNVLREEADRERRAREAEGSAPASDPEVIAVAAVAAAGSAMAPDLTDPDDSEISRDGMEGDDAVISRASRRELLPDIEEINSTLRATSDRGGEAASVDAPETLRRRRSGFRMGFSTAVLVAAVILLLYVLAPAIAAKAPATAPALETFVGAIDGFRNWLDNALRGLTASMSDG
ncbi:MAG: zinc-ribbon domain-containing protein [Proteobacteria bacterium]|nr:zinc-ribbon domain-containing protein [Pseudomonadota bacterium]